MRSDLPRRRLATAAAACLLAAAVPLTLPSTASAAQPTVGLLTATPFAVLAGTTVTNTGPSRITGDLGVAPDTAVTGFPPGTVAGVIHSADAVALQAQNDLTTAYDDAAGRTPVVDETGQDLGGKTLVAGVYQATSAMQLTGTVTVDAEGDPNAVFIFQAGSTLITASNSTVALTGGAQACHVFWQVGSSAVLGTSTTFVGTIMALTSATLQTNASVNGRVLARNGQVSLDSNVITRPACAAVPTPSVTPSVSPSPAATVSPSSGAGSGSDTGSDTSTGTSAGNGAVARAVVPQGQPATGLGGGGDPSSRRTWWLLLGILALGGSIVAGTIALGRTLPSRHPE